MDALKATVRRDEVGRETDLKRDLPVPGDAFFFRRLRHTEPLE